MYHCISYEAFSKFKTKGQCLLLLANSHISGLRRLFRQLLFGSRLIETERFCYCLNAFSKSEYQTGTHNKKIHHRLNL